MSLAPAFDMAFTGLIWRSLAGCSIFVLLFASCKVEGAQGPDLVVDAQAAQDSWYVSQEYFAPDACELQDKCIGGPGFRTLLRFDGATINAGTEDLALGSPVGNPLFEFSACHEHYHLRSYMLLEIVDPTTHQPIRVNGVVVAGHKEAFCLEDDNRKDGVKESSGFDCDNQGITAGWEDVYESSLPCQWVDVTDVPPGMYLLRIQVNPDQILPETNYQNDAAEIPVVIAGGGSGG